MQLPHPPYASPLTPIPIGSSPGRLPWIRWIDLCHATLSRRSATGKPGSGKRREKKRSGHPLALQISDELSMIVRPQAAKVSLELLVSRIPPRGNITHDPGNRYKDETDYIQMRRHWGNFVLACQYVGKEIRKKSVSYTVYFAVTALYEWQYRLY